MMFLKLLVIFILIKKNLKKNPKTSDIRREICFKSSRS